MAPTHVCNPHLDANHKVHARNLGIHEHQHRSAWRHLHSASHPPPCGSQKKPRTSERGRFRSMLRLARMGWFGIIICPCQGSSMSSICSATSSSSSSSRSTSALPFEGGGLGFGAFCTGCLPGSSSRRATASESLMPSSSSNSTRGRCSNVMKDRWKPLPQLKQKSPCHGAHMRQDERVPQNCPVNIRHEHDKPQLTWGFSMALVVPHLQQTGSRSSRSEKG